MYETGSVIAGKYRIDRVLGSGGMGVVFAATHVQLGTPVALKFLQDELTQNPSIVDRFMREAKASAQLRGENVCRVSDVGTDGRGRPFLVMELLDGQDLGTVLRNSGVVSIATAAEIIMQACIALAEAHALGIVHRDIKPGNLFWTQRPDGSALIKVLDFGVAKAPEDIHFSPTQTANVIGSPGYMSPEQLKSSSTVDARSDIWSLGIVLYELVSGRKPFHGESITELALRVAMDPVPPLVGVPASFESVILSCLEKQPHRRYKNVADLASVLAPFVGPVRGAELAYAVSRMLRGSTTSTPSTAPAHGAHSTPTTLRGATGVLTGTGAAARSRSRLPIVIGLGAAVGVALALVILIGGKRTQTSAALEPAAQTRKMSVSPTHVASPPAAPTPAPSPAAPAKVVASSEPVQSAAAQHAAAKPQPAKRVAPKAPAKPAAKATRLAKPKPRPKKPSVEDLSDSRL